MVCHSHWVVQWSRFELLSSFSDRFSLDVRLISLGALPPAKSRDTREIPGKNNMKRAKIGFDIGAFNQEKTYSRGLLSDSEIFTNLCLTFVSSSSRYLSRS